MSTGTDAANCAWGPGTSDGPLSKKRKPPHGAYFRSLPAMTSCERFWRLCLRSNRDQFCVFQSSSNGETIDVVGWRCVRTQDSGGCLGFYAGPDWYKFNIYNPVPGSGFNPWATCSEQQRRFPYIVQILQSGKIMAILLPTYRYPGRNSKC